MVVLHHTAMHSAEAALQRLCDPATGVSAHYLVGICGTLWQMVAEDERAWHAGAGQWGAVTDVNSRSIGIELASTGAHPFAAPQMWTLEALLRDILARRDIPPARVIAHSDMAPLRKFDPGPRFDWRALARQGLSVWPAAGSAPNAVSPTGFARAADIFGYAPPEAATPEDLLRAVRLRFRPWAQGALDETDCALIADLACRFPVDRRAGNA